MREKFSCVYCHFGFNWFPTSHLLHTPRDSERETEAGLCPSRLCLSSLFVGVLLDNPNEQIPLEFFGTIHAILRFEILDKVVTWTSQRLTFGSGWHFDFGKVSKLALAPR